LTQKIDAEFMKLSYVHFLSWYSTIIMVKSIFSQSEQEQFYSKIAEKCHYYNVAKVMRKITCNKGMRNSIWLKIRILYFRILIFG